MKEKSQKFLVGSHIIPWSVRKETRLDPSNGKCLCSLHDNAFDKGFITIDNNYIVVVTQSITHDLVLIDLLKADNGKRLNLPKESPPDQQFLEYHREKIFE
ncbi:MAG: HNH endonuclease [Deltaproteobacteria bacterium]|nr:HNH endonuclease [Deltaproteobacteria bacterium]